MLSARRSTTVTVATSFQKRSKTNQVEPQAASGMKGNVHVAELKLYAYGEKLKRRHCGEA